MLFRLIVICGAASVASAQFAPAASGGQPVRDKPGVVVEFEIAKGGDVIVLPVTIAGKEYPFLLEVASARTVVDARLTPLLADGSRDGEPRSIEKLPVGELPAVPMKIGNLVFTPARPLVRRDLTAHRETLGHDVYGIVGLDFLRDRIVQIDFDSGKVRVFNSERGVRAARARAADDREDFQMTVVYDFSDGPRIRLKTSGGVNEYFAVDTVMPWSVMVRPPLMDKLVANEMIAEQRASPPPSGGLRYGLLDELRLHDWTHKRLCIVEGSHDAIGLNYLSRFQLVFDFTDSKLLWAYLYPGARFNEPDRPDWNGISLILKEKKVCVASVLPNSAASQAGVLAGDVLDGLNGQPTAELTLFQIRRVFQEPLDAAVQLRRARDAGAEKDELTVRLTIPFRPPTSTAVANGCSPAATEK
jgi:hypothetical protein